VSRCLFVACGDELQPSLRPQAIDSIGDGVTLVARNAENIPDTFFNKITHQSFSTTDYSHRSILLLSLLVAIIWKRHLCYKELKS
jgi:hypothetical protein